MSLHVLYVCTANICRSPYMELLSRFAVGPDSTVTFASAGTHGLTFRKMDSPMARLLAEHGADPAAFRSQALTTELLQSADLVLTAEATHRAYILEEHPGMFRKVFTLGQFAEVVRRSDPALRGRELIAQASYVNGIAQVQADVADPYRQGEEAARAAATQIHELLEVVLPALAGD